MDDEKKDRYCSRTNSLSTLVFTPKQRWYTILDLLSAPTFSRFIISSNLSCSLLKLAFVKEWHDSPRVTDSILDLCFECQASFILVNLEQAWATSGPRAQSWPRTSELLSKAPHWVLTHWKDVTELQAVFCIYILNTCHIVSHADQSTNKSGVLGSQDYNCRHNLYL